MTREQIERALTEIQTLAEVRDDEAAHCVERDLHGAFLDHVATLDLNAPSPYIQVHRLRELARLVRSSREIAFRRNA